MVGDLIHPLSSDVYQANKGRGEARGRGGGGGADNVLLIDIIYILYGINTTPINTRQT